MLHPEKFVKLGIDPPKGVLCYGPPGTGKTLLARAVANRTDACFIRVIGSELVQKYVGEGARMVRELFQVNFLLLMLLPVYIGLGYCLCCWGNRQIFFLSER
jgi:ATP-dependent 26S proteasome regulatory subunit